MEIAILDKDNFRSRIKYLPTIYDTITSPHKWLSSLTICCIALVEPEEGTFEVNLSISFVEVIKILGLVPISGKVFAHKFFISAVEFRRHVSRGYVLHAAKIE